MDLREGREQTGLIVGRETGAVITHPETHLTGRPVQELPAHFYLWWLTAVKRLEASKVAEKRIEDYRKTIELPEEACGFLAAHGGEVIGLDLFDSPITTLKRACEKSQAFFLLQNTPT